MLTLLLTALHAGDGLEDFLASDSQEQQEGTRAKRKRPHRAEVSQKPRSTRARMDWSESSSEDQSAVRSGRPVQDDDAAEAGRP